MAKSDVKEYKVDNLTIKIDTSKCISCGTCVALAPNTYELDDDILAKVKEVGPYDDPETIKQTPDACAGGAIIVEVSK